MFSPGIFRDQGGSYDNLYRLQGGILMSLAALWLMLYISERKGNRTLQLEVVDTSFHQSDNAQELTVETLPNDEK